MVSSALTLSSSSCRKALSPVGVVIFPPGMTWVYVGRVGAGRRADGQPLPGRVLSALGAVEHAAQDGDGLGDGGSGGVGAAERVEHHEVVRDAVVADGRDSDAGRAQPGRVDRKSTRLNSSHT